MLIYCSESRKLQKSMKQQNYIEDSLGKKKSQKAIKKLVKQQTGQVAKFCRLQKFATLQNLCTAPLSFCF